MKCPNSIKQIYSKGYIMKLIKTALPYLIGILIGVLYMMFVRSNIPQLKPKPLPQIAVEVPSTQIVGHEDQLILCEMPPPPLPVKCPVCPKRKRVICPRPVVQACKPRIVPLVIEPTLGCSLRGSKETGTLIGYAPAGVNLKCTIDRLTGRIDARYWYSNNTNNRDVYNVRQ